MSIIERLVTMTVMLPCLFYFMFSTKAYANLNAGSVSYFLQLLVALLTGELIAIKIF